MDAFVIAGTLLLFSFGVSLNACVVAGNTFLSSLSFFSSRDAFALCIFCNIPCKDHVKLNQYEKCKTTASVEKEGGGGFLFLVHFSFNC